MTSTERLLLLLPHSLTDTKREPVYTSCRRVEGVSSISVYFMQNVYCSDLFRRTPNYIVKYATTRRVRHPSIGGKFTTDRRENLKVPVLFNCSMSHLLFSERACIKISMVIKSMTICQINSEDMAFGDG